MLDSRQTDLSIVTKVLLLFAGVFCSGYYYATTVAGSDLSIVILVACIVVFVFDRFLRGKTFKITKYELFFLIASLGCIGLCDLINGGGISTILVKQMLIIIVAFLVFKSVSFDIFKLIYVRTMFVIMVLALLGMIVASTNLINQLPEVENYNGTLYRSGLLFSYCEYQNSSISERIQGIFWEPGLFASYLLIGFLFLKKEHFSKTFLYYSFIVMTFVCLVASRSGAGLLLFPVTVFTKIFIEINVQRSRKGLLIFLFFLSIVAFIVFYFGVGLSWVEKYLFTKLGTEEDLSTINRIAYAGLDLRIFGMTLPFGCGITAYSTYCARLNSVGTSTLTGFLAQYGFLGIGFIVLLLRSAIRYIKKYTFFAWLGLCIVFIGIVSKEPHNLLLMMNCLLMYMLFDRERISS